MTGSDFKDYVIKTFKRNDKDIEIYDATYDVVQMLSDSYPFDDFRNIKTDQVISSGNSFTLPSDFLMFVTSINCIDTNSGWSLKQLSPDAFEKKYSYIYADSSNDGTPQEYCIINGTVYIGPYPDLSTYVYRFVYETQQVTTIDDNTVNVPFTNLNRKMLKHYVLGALYADLENAELAGLHNSLASELYENLIKKNKKNIDGVINVTINN